MRGTRRDPRPGCACSVESPDPEPGKNRMRHTFAVLIITSALAASLLAGCGGDDNNTTTTAATGTTTSAGGSPVCAAYARVQSAGEAIRQLDENSSATEVNEAAAAVTTSVQALSAAASQASSQVRARIQSAVGRYQSQLKGLSIAQRLAKLGTAVGKLESSLKETASQLNCNE